MISTIKKYVISLVLSFALVTPTLVAAEPTKLLISGKKEATVLSRVITLGDIAEISSSDIGDDNKIIELKKIQIQLSPAPAESTTISAARVLEILDRAGVNRREIGYVFPRIMRVVRASRVLSKEEIREAIIKSFKKSERLIEVKNVLLDQEIHIAPGMSTIRAIPMSNNRNRYTFNLTVSVEGESDITFSVPTEIEEWTEIPVASRPMNRGEVVRSDDLAMARLNLNALPNDTALSEQIIIGHELNNNVAIGDVFRRKSLKIPPVISSGSKVTVMFTSGVLSATATGTALESGIEGQSIKIQNDSSRRVIMANIVEPGLVRVEAQ